MQKLTVFSEDKKRITLSGPVKTGGEGAIYAIENEPGLCAKIYFKDKLTPELKDKISAMLKNPPGDNLTGQRFGLRTSSIAWPVSSLYDSDKKNAKFIGFVMPLVDTSLFKEVHRYYDPEDRLKLMGGSFSWLYLLTAAFNISFVIAAIHEKGHRIGDISASNILVARTSAVSIIDCDSFQIEDKEKKQIYYTKVATGDFLPPELMGRNFRDENIDRYYCDVFALGVIIFNLLMNGYHPFQARGNGISKYPTTEQKIMFGFFPYVRRSPDIFPPKHAPSYSIIPPAVRDLFSRCFVSGHKNKNLRPSALEWAEILREELNQIRQCRVNSNHWYSGHLDFCPWCRIKASGKNNCDIFPPEKNNAKKSPFISKKPFADESRPAKIFTPLAKFSTRHIDFRLLENDSLNSESEDKSLSFKLEIENAGDGILSGKLSSDRKWIIIKNKDFSTAKKADVEISIDKSIIPSDFEGLKFAGNIYFLSNGGNFKIPVTVAAGKAPLAEISPKKIMLKDVNAGDIVRVNAVLSNKGDGILKGSVSSDRAWINVVPDSFSTRSEQIIEIIIDTNKAGNKILVLGKVEISTNGGSISIPVGITVLKKDSTDNKSQ